MKKNILFLSLIALPAFAFAEENVVLPTITVKADSQATDATGKLKKDANLGILGEKSLLNTPFSIQSYTEQAIQDKQADSVMDVLKNDPSIRTTTNSGHLNENFKIRGLSVGWEDANINGSYGMGPTGRTPTDILGSVTVGKGPNGLVAGMPASGGISAELRPELCRYRFGENKEFGARASATYGQGEHIIDGMDDKNTAAVIGLDYTTDKAKINLDAYSVRDERDGGSPAMVSFATLKSVLAAPDGKTNYFPKLQGEQESQYVGLSGEYKLLSNLKAYAGIGYAQKEYVGHLFGTRMIVTNAAGDASTQYYRVHAKYDNSTANIGLEGQFNTGLVSHTVGLRADYLSSHLKQHYAATSSSFKTNLYNSDVGSYGEMPTTYPVWGPYNHSEFLSYSLTDQMSMLNDKLQIILGARYQDMDIDSINATTKTWSNYSKDKISPSIAFVVKPFGDSLSFYTSYVEALVQGSTVTSTADANYGNTFAPFETKQYEIGAKFQGERWLHTLAMYQIEKPSTMTLNLSTNDSRYVAGKTTTVTTDGAETKSKGIEYGVSGKVTDDLIVYGNLAYIDTKYEKAASNQGNTVEGTPEFTAGLGLDYQIPLIEGLSVNTFVTYIDDQYLDSGNTLKLPDYTLVDLGAKYVTKLGGVNTTFRANVDNVTDKKYWDGVFQSGFATIGAGRTYKLGVTFDF